MGKNIVNEKAINEKLSDGDKDLIIADLMQQVGDMQLIISDLLGGSNNA